jgi:hypothetical protein
MANIILESTAITWISAWRAAPDDKVKAFFIPKEDLSDLMLDPNNIGLRAYLGYGNTDGLPAESKLILVDVEGDINKGGTDILANGIYDFTQPCPTTCDVNSPLYTLVASGSYPIIGGNAIDVHTAIAWGTAWKNSPDLNVKAFFIPKLDIIDLLNDSNAIGVRGYLGWGTPDKNPAEAKLMLVSVEGDIGTGGTDNIINGIYDFTQPCPTTCDVNSPLYTLIQSNNY